MTETEHVWASADTVLAVRGCQGLGGFIMIMAILATSLDQFKVFIQVVYCLLSMTKVFVS